MVFHANIAAWIHGSDGGMMKKEKTIKKIGTRIVNFDAVEWCLAIDCCSA
jgi:hypothetical protein